MNKWNLIVDVARCENCHNCTLAVKDEFEDNEFTGYSKPQPRHGHEWIRIDRKVRGEGSMVDAAYLPRMCNHCDNAPCIKAGGGAVAKREDGIVMIDPEKARGRKDLVDSCPYGNIWWNEEHQVPQTWFFDAHLLDQGWSEPRCAQACPTDALRAIKVSDAEMANLVEKENLRVLHPEFNARPRVFYKNLHRYDKCFLGGSIVADLAGVEECVEGANVILKQAGREIARSQSDVFGDFKFDGLEPDSGAYELEVNHADLGQMTVEATLSESCYLGAIHLA